MADQKNQKNPSSQDQGRVQPDQQSGQQNTNRNTGHGQDINRTKQDNTKQDKMSRE